MLEKIPSPSDMTELLGQPLFEVWQALCTAIDEKYEMERVWNTGGKNWNYEYKYRNSFTDQAAGRNAIGLPEIFEGEKKNEPQSNAFGISKK